MVTQMGGERMNGKAYSGKALSLIITAADHYIEATDVRNSIIAKCHWEIGLVVCDAPDHQRSAIKLTPQETKALNNAISQLRASKLTTAGQGAEDSNVEAS